MSFLKKQYTILKSAFSLRTHFKTYTDKNLLIFPKIKRKSLSKRISSVISISAEGGLTVEAALVIPIFLFAIMAVLSFVEMLRLQMNLDSAMQQCAKELATYGYAQSTLSDENTVDLPFPLEALFSETYVRNRIISAVGSDYLDNSPLEGNLYFTGSRIMEDDRIELRCVYYVMPFFSLSPEAGFLTGETAVVRAFTGYDNLTSASVETTEEYVYITEYGTAYHKDRGCPYLDLSVNKIFSENLENERNKDGSKYYACDICTGSGSGTVVYITDYGEKYHSDILCSGLRRTVESVPISQVGNRTPCKKCVQ